MLIIFKQFDRKINEKKKFRWSIIKCSHHEILYISEKEKFSRINGKKTDYQMLQKNHNRKNVNLIK
jgi:hypothetical protein